MSELTGYFVAPDADDEPRIWRRDGTYYPVPVLAQRDLRKAPDLWDALVALVERGAS